jgi:hypothetical protein
LLVGLLVAAGLGLAGLVAARSLGLFPDRLMPLVLAVLGGVALVVAFALPRRLTDQSVARLVDARSGTKELFLSAVRLPAGVDDFLPLVQQAAEERASKIDVSRVAPFRWGRGAAQLFLAVLCLAAVWRWAPQFDPFRKVEQREKLSEQRRKLEESRKITALRTETLESEARQQAAQIQQALARVEKTFQEARPQDKEATLRQLATEQHDLGELWRKVNDDRLEEALGKSTQSFGRMDLKERNAWRDQLEKGDFTGLQRELDGLEKQLADLAAQTDSAEKRTQQEQLMQKLSQFSEAMKDLVHSPEVNDALNRAIAQMDAARQSELSQEALRDAANSLELGKKELDQVAQSMKDGKTLEEALKSVQDAKKLAEAGKMDGSEAQDAQTLAAYQALYQEKVAQLGGRPGQDNSTDYGAGPESRHDGQPPDDNLPHSGFKSEKSLSALKDGKLLLEWKTNDVGQVGERADQFRDAVRAVQQGATEALQAEQVPPGYHDTVRKYFDTMAGTK